MQDMIKAEEPIPEDDRLAAEAAITDKDAQYAAVNQPSRMPGRFRAGIGRTASVYGTQVPTHSREDVLSPTQRTAQRTAQREHNAALLERLAASRTPDERQAVLDKATSERAQDAFSQLTTEVQVSLLHAIGVNIDRKMDEEFATQVSEGTAALQAMVAATEQAPAEDRQFEEDSANLPQRHYPRRPVTAEQAALFRIAAPPQLEYSPENSEPDNGFTAEQRAEIKATTAPVDAARAAAEDIIDAYHRAGGIS